MKKPLWTLQILKRFDLQRPRALYKCDSIAMKVETFLKATDYIDFLII